MNEPTFFKPHALLKAPIIREVPADSRPDDA
jgi:hypothetical protein